LQKQNEALKKTEQLTCNTNFWSMYFLAMLGWNSWLSKNRMKNSYTSCKRTKKQRPWF